ncbi:MAG: hypothetical protein ACMUEL_02050 [Flavobacteriales bacterium Tduv]
MFRLFGVENKKISSMLRNTAQISFSELYTERFIRTSKFFKRLKTLIHLESMDKEIKKIYQKGQGIKSQPTYSSNIIIYDDAFESLV